MFLIFNYIYILFWKINYVGYKNSSYIFLNKILYIYTHINSNLWKTLFIFSWNFQLLKNPIGSLLYQYFPHMRIIFRKWLKYSLRHIWWYLIFNYSDVAYFNPYIPNNISFMLGIGEDLHFNLLFKWIKSLINNTLLVLFVC